MTACRHPETDPMPNDVEHLDTRWTSRDGDDVTRDVSLTFGTCTTCGHLMASVVLWDLEDHDPDHPGLPRATGWRPLEPVNHETVPTRLTTEQLHRGGS
jgi:hypothetical protein